MNKKGNAGMVLLVVIAVLLVGVFAMQAGLIGSLSFDGMGSGGSDAAVGGTCDGISSVTVTYNDVDKYTPGTDPEVGNLYITTDNKGSQAEGAITLSPSRQYKGLAAENSSDTVFAVPVEFTTSCVNEDLVVEVVKSGVPTITFVNDNGLTQNSDANAEAVDADSEYTFEATIKSASDACSSKYGALLVADYDKTYLSDIDVNGLSGAQAPTYLSHGSLTNATADAFKAWKYEGELCDSAKLEITGSYTTTSTATAENNANIRWHWLPLDYDINQDTLEIIGPAAEDEDNNEIVPGNTTKEFFTA